MSTTYKLDISDEDNPTLEQIVEAILERGWGIDTTYKVAMSASQERLGTDAYANHIQVKEIIREVLSRRSDLQVKVK